MLGFAFTHGGPWRDMAASTRPAAAAAGRDSAIPELRGSPSWAAGGASSGASARRVVVADLPPLPRRAHAPLRSQKLGNWPAAWRLRGR